MPAVYFSPSALRRLRETRGYTREMLAVAIGRSAPAIVRLELGTMLPSLATAAWLAEALAVGLSELFTTEAETPRIAELTDRSRIAVTVGAVSLHA